MRHRAHIIGPSAGAEVALGRGMCGHFDKWVTEKIGATVQNDSEVEGSVRALIESDGKWLYARGESLLLLAPESH